MESTQPDLVTCSCNNCDGHLQFERQHAGARISCPHCGMETQLYIPQPSKGARPKKPTQPEPPMQPAPADEVEVIPPREATPATVGDILGKQSGPTEESAEAEPGD